MADRNDILNNSDGTLQTAAGDFVVGNSDEQHIMDILESRPGDWKRTPTTGYGIYDAMKSEINQASRKRMQKQLQAEGYDIADVSVNIADDE